MRLTSDQTQQYRRDGYLVVENFVPAAACEALRARAAELVEGFEPGEFASIFSTREQSRLSDDYFLNSGDQIRFFFEADAFRADGTLKRNKQHALNKIGHALHDLDPAFNKFSRTPELKQLVADLGVAEPRLLQGMYIFKQPEIGGEVTCHQDSTFLYTEPAEIVGLWFALEDATLENGCLWAIPGGHRRGLKSRWLRADDGSMKFDVFDPEPWEEAELLPLEVKQGAVIVLHGLLPHKSLANRSHKSRHAYTLHVIPAACSYPASNWLQRSDGLPLRGFD